eukprot:RCo038027
MGLGLHGVRSAGPPLTWAGRVYTFSGATSLLTLLGVSHAPGERDRALDTDLDAGAALEDPDEDDEPPAVMGAGALEPEKGWSLLQMLAVDEALRRSEDEPWASSEEPTAVAWGLLVELVAGADWGSAS